MLQTFGGVVDQHRQAGRGAPGARHMLAGHVPRNAAVLVRQGGELLQDPQQLLGVRPRLEEADGGRDVLKVVVLGLPNLPGVHLGDVLPRRQAGGVDLDLGTRGDPHVVRQRAGAGVDHVLGIAHQVNHRVTPERTGDLLVAGRVVGLPPQGIVVQHRADDGAAHQPHLAGVAHEGVFDLGLWHPPLNQQVALDAVPELQGVDQVVGVVRVRLLTLGVRALGVDPQPLVQPPSVEIRQHGFDRGLVVTLHPDHGL